MQRTFLQSCIFLLSILFAQLSFAATKNSAEVNVLTWWGYLAEPWVHQMVMDKCQTKITYDEYYTNDDFMRRFRQYKESYDLIIFPSMDYKALKKEIGNNNSQLYKNSENYARYIKENYRSSSYGPNVAYFLLSYSVFLYNPNNINLSEKDNIGGIFEKAKSKVVVLTDEPIYINHLLSIDPKQVELDQAFEIFSKLTRNSKIVVTNEISPAYNDSNFAFAFTWPGIALYAMKNQYPTYKMLLHPNFSLISADLLVQMNNKQSSQCVAQVMASKEFLSKMQNDALYLSPYGDSNQIVDKNLKQAHKVFFAVLPKLKWFESIGAEEYRDLNSKWSYYFRLKANQQKQKSNV